MPSGKWPTGKVSSGTESPFFIASSSLKAPCSTVSTEAWAISFVPKADVSSALTMDAQLQGSIMSVPAFRQAFGTLVNGEYIVPAGWQSAWNDGQRFASLFIALGAGSLGDLIGRRNTLFIACVTCIVSVFMMVFVKDHNYIQQLFARMINGGSCAIFSAVAGVYACELSPLPVRGLTTAGLNIWIVVGQL
jgi:MFS family permease